MPKASSLSTDQLQSIYALKDAGKSIREISAETGHTKSKVETALHQRDQFEQAAKIAALAQRPVAQQAVSSVFNITELLEETLRETLELLKDKHAPLGQRVMVRSEMRQLAAEARATLEACYAVKAIDEFFEEVASILESVAPGARKRLFERLEASAVAQGVIGVFSRRAN